MIRRWTAAAVALMAGVAAGGACSALSGLDDFELTSAAASSGSGGAGQGGSGGTGGFGGEGGAPCNPGTTETCETGLEGACASGTQVCNTQGEFGACIADDASVENCSAEADDNCDGQVECTGAGQFTMGLALQEEAHGLGVAASADPRGHITVTGIESANINGETINTARMFLAQVDGAGSVVVKQAFGDATSKIIPGGLAVGGADDTLLVTGTLKGQQISTEAPRRPRGM